MDRPCQTSTKEQAGNNFLVWLSFWVPLVVPDQCLPRWPRTGALVGYDQWHPFTAITSLLPSREVIPGPFRSERQSSNQPAVKSGLRGWRRKRSGTRTFSAIPSAVGRFTRTSLFGNVRRATSYTDDSRRQSGSASQDGTGLLRRAELRTPGGTSHSSRRTCQATSPRGLWRGAVPNGSL